MTQKQIAGVLVGVVVVIASCVFVYQQYTTDSMRTDSTVTTSSDVAVKNSRATNSEKEAVLVPDTIDGIAGSIVSQTTVDATALDDEETAALGDVTEDSDSVNNLGTSYDENNL